MSQKIEFFRESTLDELRDSVNEFVQTTESIEVVSVSLTEDEYGYTVALLYRLGEVDDYHH